MTTRAALTHHEMLALAGPFVRAGWRTDLVASDRAVRRIVFRPATSVAGPPCWIELDNPRPGFWRLRRISQHADGQDAPPGGPARGDALAPLSSWVEAEGDDPAVLWDRVQAVAPQAGRLAGVGWWAALGLRCGKVAGSPPALREMVARVAGLQVTMKLSGVGGYPADIELARADEALAPRALPDDLLAVLGHAFAPLTPVRRGWLGTLRLRGEEPWRTEAARRGLQAMMDHLARTLAEPPARFHRRHRAARWRVAARDTLPWLVGLAVVGLALAARELGPEGRPFLALLANAAPPVLLAWIFMRREMMRLRWPRWPRPPAPEAWAAAASRGARTPEFSA